MAAMHPRRLEQRILKAVNLANRRFGLLAEGDRIMVGMSGGKDSYSLLWALQKLQAAAPYKFELFAFHLHQGQPGHNPKPLSDYLQSTGVPFEVEEQDTYARVIEMTEPGKTYCAVCARFRRAIIYKAARRHDCNKVALGHHREDLLETLLLNLFFEGQMKTMPPYLISDEGTDRVIRPLCLVPESELIELGEQKGFPILPCGLCGSQDKERKAMKFLLAELETRYPRIKTSMLAGLGNICKTHMLDPALNPLFTSSHERVPRAGEMAGASPATTVAGEQAEPLGVAAKHGDAQAFGAAAKHGNASAPKAAGEQGCCDCSGCDEEAELVQLGS